MKIHRDIEQASLEWFMVRAGLVTASGFKNIVTPAFKARDGEMVQTYLATLVAEKWCGPLPSVQVFETEQGSLLESEVVNWFEFANDCKFERVGFISDDSGRFGCSPDGIINGNEGAEIKCPQPVNHFKYLLNGEVPDAYLPQVHFSLYVSGFDRWKFVSYRRNAPALIVDVVRDPVIMGKIHDALMPFLDRLDAAMKRMEEINGGPPQRLKPLTPISPKPEKESKPINLTYLQ